MATGNSGKENTGEGNLNIIIHTGGESAGPVNLSQSTETKDASHKDSSTGDSKEAAKKSLELESLYFDGEEAIKLNFFFNEEINNLVSYPNVKLKLPKNPEEEDHFILIRYPPSRKEHFQKENKRLEKLIKGLFKKEIECKNKDRMKIAVEQFKKEKSTVVLMQQDWEKRKILIFSKDDKRLGETEKFLLEVLDEKDGSSQKSLTSSRVRRNLADSTHAQSQYDRQTSDKNASSNSTKQTVSSRAGRKLETSVNQSSRHNWSDPNEDDGDSVTSHKTKFMGEKFEFSTKEGLIVKLYRGSITKLNVDAIVNAANEHLRNIGGVAQAISNAAGKALEDGCTEQIRKRKMIHVSENCVTVSGNLPCSFVIHAVGPNWHDYRDKKECLIDLCDTVVNVLKKSQERKFKVVVMPPISSGIFSVPQPCCAAMYLKGIIDFSQKCTGKRQVEEFHIIDIKDEMLNLIHDVYQKWKKDPSCIDPDKLVQGYSSKGSRSYQRSDSSEKEWRSQGKRSDNFKGSSSYQRPDQSDSWNQDITEAGHKAVTISQPRMTVEKDGSTSFNFNGNLKVWIYHGNLLNLENIVDVIASTENCTVSGTGGLARALLEKAGNKYVTAHKTLLGGNKQLQVGSVLITHAGKLQFRNIYHVVIEQFQCNTLPTYNELRKQKLSVTNVLEKANMVPLSKTDKKKKQKKGGVSAVAMALFGSGKLTIPVYIERHCEKVYEAISEFAYMQSLYHNLCLSDIHLVNMNPVITKIMTEVFTKQSQYSVRKKPPTDRPVHQGSYDKGKSGGNAFYNAGYGYNKFDPEKYLQIDKWRMKPEPRLRGRDINEFIEPVRKPKSFGSSQNSLSSGKKGNLKLINSDMTMSCTSQGQDTTILLPEVNGKFECIACKTKRCNGYSFSCNHTICTVCRPGYGSVCPTCSQGLANSHGATASVTTDEEESDVMDDCVICMDDMNDPVQFKQCKHQFCRECIAYYFSTKAACPVCNTIYGIVYGNQPKSGTAKVYRDKNSSLPGYKSCDTFIIDYNFSDGVQEECHPNPGTKYKGLRRQAYLPDNMEGNKVMGLLRKAFEQGLTFTIGRSRTTGEENVLTWNDIHHKTRREGGPERFGYPDEDYFKRVTEELEAKGIYDKAGLEF